VTKEAETLGEERSADMRLDIALMNKGAYPEPTNGIELVQTHISLVFLTDNYVYKIKKPVNFGFLDFSTLQKRKHYCEREVELNKRLSLDTYLAVLPVTVNNHTVAIDGKGQIIEYVVKMRRLPMENLMIRLLKENRLSREMVERVARRIALFHAEAARSNQIDKFGGIEVIRNNTDENFAQTQKYVGKSITKSQYDAIRSFTEDYLNNRSHLFDRRIAEGKIKDCHGDLHLEHICITEPIRIFDCIEFNDRFRYSDTAADIAFLAMDLDFHGRKDLSEALMDAYVRFSGDKGVLDIVNFYKVYRAYVRGKVTSFRLDSPDPVSQDQMLRTAQKYFSLAASYVHEETMTHGVPQNRPKLVITCGLMGTGKTTIAKKVAEKTGWALISSDEVRKELARIPATQHEYVPWGKGIYSTEFSEKTYKRMREIAEKLLRKGRAVVVDASFGKKSERADIYALTRATNAEFTCIELVCPEDEIKRRLTTRVDERGTISDGRWAIFADQKANFEKVDDFVKEEHVIVDTSKQEDDTMKQIMHALGMRD
jgi:hypothetical protein